MSTFSVDGLISGLKTTDIISRLSQLDRAPIQQLQARKSAASTRLQTWQTLNTRLLSLRDRARTLDAATTYRAAMATVSDATVLAASAGSAAALGSYAVTVNWLATAHQLVTSNAVADKDAQVFGTGTVTVQVGGTVKVATIGATNNSLAGIAAAINDAGALVTASVVQDATGYKLMLSSTATGAASTVTVTPALSGGSATLGPFDEMQAARDAQLVLGTGGSQITVNRATNVITDLVPGLTLALTKAGGPVTVKVERDTEAIKRAVTGFVDAYSEFVAFLSKQIKYDSTTKTGGPLVADPTARRIQRVLPDTLLAFALGGTGAVRRLTDLGVSLGRDGTLTVNQTKLADALASNLASAQAVLATTGSASDPDIAFVLVGRKTVEPASPGYAIQITQAATRGSYAAGVRTQGVTDPGAAAVAVSGGDEVLTFSGDLFPSPVGVTLANGTTPAQMAAQINGDGNVNTKVYAWIDGNGRLRVAGKTFGAAFTVTSSGAGSGSGYSPAGTTAAQTSSGLPTEATGVTGTGETLTVDGTTNVVLAAGLTLSAAATAFNSAMASAGKAVRASVAASGMALVFERTEYGSGTTTLVSSADGPGTLGVATATLSLTGTNVAGTINGEAATGAGQILTGNAGNTTTDGLVIRVALSPAELTAQGGSQGTVTFTRGAAARLATTIDNLADATSGTVTGAIRDLQDRIAAFDTQVTALERRVEIRRQQYVRTFAALEDALARLRTQSAWLSQQTAALGSRSSGSGSGGS